MCALSDDVDGPWVDVEGTAEVLDPPDALDPLCGSARQGTSVIRLSVERRGPIATGGIPARLATG